MNNIPQLPENPLWWFRFFLKDTVRSVVDFRKTDQSRGLPPPPVEKPANPSARRVRLTPPEAFEGEELGRMSLLESIRRRESVRQFTETPLTLSELSFLLWATQGVRRTMGRLMVLRTVPSAGNRHALETYVYCRLVAGVEAGIYRYLPLEHELVLEQSGPDLEDRIIAGCRGQVFAGLSAVTFLWAAVPYRMEWRYGLAAHKVIALDAGHVCQSLYLACQTIEAGTCAIAAYDQELLDTLLDLDGENEFVLYVAPVGKVI